MDLLAPALRSLVRESVALLGNVIERELGQKTFRAIEKMRKEMAALRAHSDRTALRQLEKLYLQIEGQSVNQKHQIATCFTLMLELMNSAENA